MNLNQRINAFVKLGNALINIEATDKEALYSRAQASNQWFRPNNIDEALAGIRSFLNEKDLRTWAERYSFSSSHKKVGLVMAGNIPLVGFHDLMCVLVSGHKAVVKLSSQDEVLSRYVIDALIKIEPQFNEFIEIADRLNHVEAVIATGSDNTARYFEYYFKHIPHIIRKNRTSCAVLDGKESEAELHELGKDIFQYYGLGCRNVSKVFVPEGFDFPFFFRAIESHQPIIDHHKYTNNYEYRKSIFLVNRHDHLDNGFLLVQENESLTSPISVLYYEYYKDQALLKQKLEAQKEKIQCIVSREANWPESFDLGQAQRPKIDDYADGVDTMKFLAGI